jgi:hypothetical protein
MFVGKIFRACVGKKKLFLKFVGNMYKYMCVDKRWLPVEEVWAEDGQGEPLPQSLLSLHNGHRMPRQEAGIALLLSQILVSKII